VPAVGQRDLVEPLRDRGAGGHLPGVRHRPGGQLVVRVDRAAQAQAQHLLGVDDATGEQQLAGAGE